MSKISNLLRAIADLLEEDVQPKVRLFEIPSPEKSKPVKSEPVSEGTGTINDAQKIAYDTWAFMTGVDGRKRKNPFAQPFEFDPTTWERKPESEEGIVGYNPLKPVIKIEEEALEEFLLRHPEMEDDSVLSKLEVDEAALDEILKNNVNTLKEYCQAIEDACSNRNNFTFKQSLIKHHIIKMLRVWDVSLSDVTKTLDDCKDYFEMYYVPIGNLYKQLENSLLPQLYKQLENSLLPQSIEILTTEQMKERFDKFANVPVGDWKAVTHPEKYGPSGMIGRKSYSGLSGISGIANISVGISGLSSGVSGMPNLPKTDSIKPEIVKKEKKPRKKPEQSKSKKSQPPKKKPAKPRTKKKP